MMHCVDVILFPITNGDGMDTQESATDWKMWALRAAVAIPVIGFVLTVMVHDGFNSEKLGSAVGAVAAFAAIAALVLLYFLPTFFAFDRKHLNRQAILILNLTLGWLVLPWIIALVWAFKNDGVIKNAVSQPLSSEVMFRKCPYCAEEVRPEAIKCKHCQSELIPIQHWHHRTEQQSPPSAGFCLASVALLRFVDQYSAINGRISD